MSYDDLDCPTPRGPRLTDLRAGCLPNLFTLPRELETSYEVPKRLHHVWTDEAIPEEYQRNAETFRKLNPDWEVTVWNASVPWRATLDKLGLLGVYDHEKNLGGKSDVLRLAIVHELGGVYCDLDTVCKRPLNPEVFGQSFVASHVGAPWRNVTNALFGFPAGSKFLEYVIRALPLNYRCRLREPGPNRTGPTFFTTCLLSYDDPKIRLVEQRVLNLTEESYMHHQLHANWVEKKR